MKVLLAQEVDRIQAERSQAEVQTVIEEVLAQMLQLGVSEATNGIKIVSVRFLETVLAELFSRGAEKPRTT